MKKTLQHAMVLNLAFFWLFALQILHSLQADSLRPRKGCAVRHVRLAVGPRQKNGSNSSSSSMIVTFASVDSHEYKTPPIGGVWIGTSPFNMTWYQETDSPGSCNYTVIHNNNYSKPYFSSWYHYTTLSSLEPGKLYYYQPDLRINRKSGEAESLWGPPLHNRKRKLLLVMF